MQSRIHALGSIRKKNFITFSVCLEEGVESGRWRVRGRCLEEGGADKHMEMEKVDPVQGRTSTLGLAAAWHTAGCKIAKATKTGGHCNFSTV